MLEDFESANWYSATTLGERFLLGSEQKLSPNPEDPAFAKLRLRDWRSQFPSSNPSSGLPPNLWVENFARRDGRRGLWNCRACRRLWKAGGKRARPSAGLGALPAALPQPPWKTARLRRVAAGFPQAARIAGLTPVFSVAYVVSASEATHRFCGRGRIE